MKVKSNNLKLSNKQYPPLTSHEKKLIIIFSTMLFLITFNYGMLRAMKDVKVLGKANSHFLSNIKLWVVLPFMFIFKFIYDTLARYVGKDNMLYWLVGLFTLFFLSYILFADHFISEIPEDNKSDWVIYTKIWPIICFYVMAETWGTYMLSVSFWSLANRTMSNQQAKRFYTTLSLGAAISTFLAGVFIFIIKKEDTDKLIWLILCLNFLLVGVYYYFRRDVKSNPTLYAHGTTKKKKKKLGFFASIKALVTSKDSAYLGLILALVMCYGMGINFFETPYKQLLKDTGTALGDKDKYLRTMLGLQLMLIGVVSGCLVFLAPLVKRRGWRFTASVVPVCLGIGCIVFFGVCYWQGQTMDKDTMWYISGFGLCIVAIVKGSKYVFFDTSKEQTYKVSSEETQLTGKSAVDGVGSRVSKATSSGIITFIKYATGITSILEYKGVIGCLAMFVLVIWLWAVSGLSKRYEKRLHAYEAEQEKAKAAKQAPKA